MLCEHPITVTSLSSESQKATPHPVTTVSRERAHPKTRTSGERGLARRVSPPNSKCSTARFKRARSTLLGTGPAGDPEGRQQGSALAPGSAGARERLAPRSRAAGSRREGRRPRAVSPLFARSAIVPRSSRVSRSLGRRSRSRAVGTSGCRARNPGTRTSHFSERRGDGGVSRPRRAELAQRVFVVCLFANLFSSPSQAAFSTGTATCTLRT